MSDDDEHTASGSLSAQDHDADKNDEAKAGSSSDDDDDSSSSSSGSSSDSDSDSESEKEGDGDESKASRSTSDDRKLSIESLSSSSHQNHHGSNGLGRRTNDDSKQTATDLSNVNSTLAAARFREQASTETGLMALGTKKRDRRTIEEIQRDIQMKRGRPVVAALTGVKKSLGATTTPARTSPPKSSPVMSPESGNEVERMNLVLAGKAPGNGIKPKANSARSRLEKKLLGRGGGGGGASAAARSAATNKKPAATASGATTTVPVVTKMTRTSGTSGTHSGSGSDHDLERSMEPKIEPRVVDTSLSSTSSSSSAAATKPDGRVVRSVLRGMLRYGDLTDVNLFPQENPKAFNDEFKLPNFVERAMLETHCKMSEEKILALACEIAEAVQRVVLSDKDTLKFGDVEMKPSQFIERLYENLKLRVAVQRALYDLGAKSSKGGASPSTAYVLVSRHSDASVLGVGRDFPAWSWAEREHDWNSKKDAALLIGIYIHGFGSWEDILNDDRLNMQQQRALKGERLKKRAENLLKRVPPPLSGPAGEPRVVQMAAAMLSGSQTPGQQLGANISAIVNGAMVKGGRMQRAEERLAARAQGGGDSGVDEIPEDSIRKIHTQSNGRERERSRDRSAENLREKPRPGERERGRDNSRERSRDRDRDRERDRDRDRDRGRDKDRERERERDRDRDRDRGRDRERDQQRKPSASPPPTRAPSRSPRPDSVDENRDSSRREHSSSKSSSAGSVKRAASDEATSNGDKGRGDGGHSPRKKSKLRDGDAAPSRASSGSKSSTEQKTSSSSSSSSAKRKRSDTSFVDKWKPKQRLHEIRTVLKKVKIMSDWSKTQSDVVVVDKMLEYVATIGEHIDKAVVAACEQTGEVKETQRDQFCSALWTYAAEFTPFPPVTFERLYDDLCADGEQLRDVSSKPVSARRQSAAAS